MKAGILMVISLPLLGFGCLSLDEPLADKLDGRSYYYFEDNFVCAQPAPGSVTMPSWRDKFTFGRDPQSGKFQVYQTGSRCDDYVAYLDFNLADFMFGPDLSILMYQGNTYEYREEVPFVNTGCTEQFQFGINVLVKDADTGASINNAVLTLTDGDYIEVMQFFPTGFYVGACQRPGAYTLTVAVPGAATATVPMTIPVGFDGSFGVDALVAPGQIDFTYSVP